MPNSAALSMAISIAFGPTCRPMPRSASSVALTADSRTVLTSGVGFRRPSAYISRYRRTMFEMPCDSQPRRSLLMSTSAHSAASSADIPIASKSACVPLRAAPSETRT